MAHRLVDLNNHERVGGRLVARWTLSCRPFLVTWAVAYLYYLEGLFRRAGGPGPLESTAATVACKVDTVLA